MKHIRLPLHSRASNTLKVATAILNLLMVFVLSGIVSPLCGQKGMADGVFKLDALALKKLISRADLIYDRPASRSEAGQPVGNGRMGSLIWTTPSQIRMQINRVDIFGNGSNSDNFYARNTDYCGGAGFVDLDFGRPVFAGKDFHQKLSVYDGSSSVQTNAVNAKVIAWTQQDVMAVQVIDKSVTNAPFQINLRTLRMPVTKKGNHSAISSVRIQGDYIVLTQVFKEGDFYCSSAVVARLVGHQGKKGYAELVNERTVRLTELDNTAGPVTVFIASAASFDSTQDVTAKAIQKLKLAEQKGFEGLYADNKTWWADFWRRSFIHLTSPDQIADEIEKNYTYFLYVMGASSRGDYPVKFNGMLWTTGGDARKWGGAYWGANQSCFYEALFPTGHIELMAPMFHMYTKGRASFSRAAIEQWGSKGIYIPETVGFDGVPALPEDIAKEMRDLYLLRKPWKDRSERFKSYAYTKPPFQSRWNWKYTGHYEKGRWQFIERGDGPFGPVNHIFSRGAKIAYSYWQQYEYTLDTAWLRKRAYPMLKGVAEFYRNFPNLIQGKDGKYSIIHVNDNESIWDAENPVEEIAAMKGIFPVAIKAATLLGVDSELRQVWAEVLQNLSALPTSKDYPKMKGQPEVWVGAKSSQSPVRGHGSRLPDGNTMPVWFFDLCNKDGDAKMRQIANQTFDAYFKNRTPAETHPHILSKIPAAAAVLNRADAIQYLLPNMLQGNNNIHVMENRMDLSEGFYTTNIQRIGRVADALQQSLCQSAPPAPGQPPIIEVFAAWPRIWDAQFTLLSRGGFVTSAAIRNGEIIFTELKSKAGATCSIRNPWKNEKTWIYKNGKFFKETNAATIQIDTRIDDELVLVPKGTKLANLTSQLY